MKHNNVHAQSIAAESVTIAHLKKQKHKQQINTKEMHIMIKKPRTKYVVYTHKRYNWG